MSKSYMIPELCVADREANMYHDSYFYATFYVPEKDTFVEEMIGTTAFYGGQYHFEIAAPQELREKYRAMVDKADAEREAATVRPGKNVTIDNTRKFKGKVGIVKWIGPNRFNYNRGEVACVEFADGQVTYPDLRRVLVSN